MSISLRGVTARVGLLFLWACSWNMLALSSVSAQNSGGQSELPDTIRSAKPDSIASELPDTIVSAKPDSPPDSAYPANSLSNDTVISATRTAEPAAVIGSAVTVITAEQIAQTRQTSAAEILRGQLGLDVVRQGGPGGVTSVFLRGANSQHTKVLLDGISINDPSNATRGFDFSSLSVDNIERIEVLRGPQSVLYGTDALGGVVNIITKRGSGPMKTQATLIGGSYGTVSTGAQASGGTKKYYYSLGGSWLHSDSFSQANKYRGATENDRYRNGTVSGRVGWTPDEKLNVDYVFRYNDVQADVDDFDFGLGRPIDNLIRRNLSSAFYNRVQLQSFLLDEIIEQRVGFNLTDYNRRDTDPGAFSPGRFNGQTREVDYILNTHLTERNTVSVGGNYLQEDGSTSFDPLQVQTRKGVFVQDQWQIGERWFNTVGARWDDNSRAGPAETYRYTSAYKLEQTGTTLHGSIGTGFRAPSLAEALFAFGNPGLLPELSKGWDYGIGQSIIDDVWTVDATYFRNDFTNLIVFDLGTFSLQNVGQARTHGVELTSTWVMNRDTSLIANYTLTDTNNLDTGNVLLRRPRNKASLTLSRAMLDQKARLNAYLLYVDQRLDTGSNLLNPYLTLNLSGSYRPNDRVEWIARVDNLTDTRYEEVFGYGVPGISGYGGLSVWW